MRTSRTKTVTGRTLKDRLSKLTAIDLAEVVKKDIQERFDKSLNADNSRMTPLKPQTIALKRKRGGIAVSRPLVFKGGTQKGIRTQEISRTEAWVLATGKASGYYGGEIDSKKMLGYQISKGRSPYGISDKAKKGMNKIIKAKLG